LFAYFETKEEAKFHISFKDIGTKAGCGEYENTVAEIAAKNIP
jgi:hypothetical protein